METFEHATLGKVEAMLGAGYSQSEMADALDLTRSQLCGALKQLKALSVQEYADLQEMMGATGIIDWESGDIKV